MNNPEIQKALDSLRHGACQCDCGGSGFDLSSFICSYCKVAREIEKYIEQLEKSLPKP